LCAIEGGWCHLYALVRFYPIELLFVARPVMDQRLIEPPAPLNSRVPADKMVLLFFHGVD